jgi:hypothetical protein
VTDTFLYSLTYPDRSIACWDELIMPLMRCSIPAAEHFCTVL